MAASTKTRAQLETLFLDNNSKEISPEDARCFILSALGDFGGWSGDYDGSTYTLAVPTGTTYTQMPATSLVLTNFTSAVQDGSIAGDATNRQLQISATTPGPTVVLVVACISGYVPSDTWRVGIFKNSNATPEEGTMRVYKAAANNLVLCGLVSVTAGDTLCVKCRHNAGGSLNFTFEAMHLFAVRVK